MGAVVGIVVAIIIIVVAYFILSSLYFRWDSYRAECYRLKASHEKGGLLYNERKRLKVLADEYSRRLERLDSYPTQTARVNSQRGAQMPEKVSIVRTGNMLNIWSDNPETVDKLFDLFIRLPALFRLLVGAEFEVSRNDDGLAIRRSDAEGDQVSH